SEKVITQTKIGAKAADARASTDPVIFAALLQREPIGCSTTWRHGNAENRTITCNVIAHSPPPALRHLYRVRGKKNVVLRKVREIPWRKQNRYVGGLRRSWRQMKHQHIVLVTPDELLKLVDNDLMVPGRNEPLVRTPLSQIATDQKLLSLALEKFIKG